MTAAHIALAPQSPQTFEILYYFGQTLYYCAPGRWRYFAPAVNLRPEMPETGYKSNASYQPALSVFDKSAVC